MAELAGCPTPGLSQGLAVLRGMHEARMVADTCDPYTQGRRNPIACLLNLGALQLLQSGRKAEQRSVWCSWGRGLPPPDLCQPQQHGRQDTG